MIIDVSGVRGANQAWSRQCSLVVNRVRRKRNLSRLQRGYGREGMWSAYSGFCRLCSHKSRSTVDYRFKRRVCCSCSKKIANRTQPIWSSDTLPPAIGPFECLSTAALSPCYVSALELRPCRRFICNDSLMRLHCTLTSLSSCNSLGTRIQAFATRRDMELDGQFTGFAKKREAI